MPDTATPAQRAAARLFVAAHLGQLTTDEPLLAALRDTYGDAYVTGLLVGAQQTGVTVDWAPWTPGNRPAAALLDQGGLADLLGNANITIKGIVGSTLDGLGNVLADGVAQGLGPDAIARSMGDWLNDPQRALMIARTETARALETASQEQYATAGIHELDWLASPGACSTCLDYAAGGPYTLATFPSLPAHPWCRCSSAPRDPGSRQ